MSISNPRVAGSNAIAASPAAATETVVCKIEGVSTRTADEQIILQGHVALTIGTAGASVTLNIRRGTDTTGTVVATGGANTATAGDVESYSIGGTDTPGDVADEGYVLTATVASATAASTVHDTYLSAIY